MATTKSPAEYLPALVSHYVNDGVVHPTWPEPWFGALEILRSSGGSPLFYKIGRNHDPKRRILHHLRPVAQAYYENQAGEEVELEGPGFETV
jgi:hypothetical protein